MPVLPASSGTPKPSKQISQPLLLIGLRTEVSIGAFVLSKAANDPALVLEGIDHLRRYLECVLGRTAQVDE